MARGQARPDNAAVADILADTADLLEIRGEVLFKVLAYRKASHEVRTLARDIYEYVKDQTITDLPGIGSSIAEKIAEILATGTCAFFEELKLSLPVGLVSLMELQGLGPKKAKLLYDELGISTLEELEKAVEANELRDLKGFGAKSEENIRRGIELYRAHHERILLSEAYPLAGKLVASLMACPGVVAAQPGGSLRRMQETIGDIDVLAAGEQPADVTACFVGLPEVDRVLAQGETKASVVAHTGLQVDLRVVAPDEWGAALMYFTGSQDHNVRLREVAKDLGYKLNEYGLFRLDDGTRVAGATEEEVYCVLGMQMIPATMRTDRGEIALARRDALPTVVGRGDIRGDLHIHTDLSDGIDGLERLIEKARELGYAYLAITDHAEQLRVARGLTSRRLEESLETIANMNETQTDVTLLTGAELNIGNDGELDYPDELLQRLDVVVASIHAGMNQDVRKLTRRTIAAMENPHVDIIAHPTGRILGRRDPYPIDIQAVVEAAVTTHTALELNSYPDRLDLRDEHLRLCREAGAKVAINTDAHSADQLEYVFYGVATAQRGWLEPKDVLNAWPLGELMGWLARASHG